MGSFTMFTPKGPREIGPESPSFVIAEMSVNHAQDYGIAEAIVHAAADAGADAVKVQTFKPESLTLECSNEWFVLAEEKNPASWQGMTMYDLYQKAYTPWEWHAPLQKLAEELGLVFFSTALHDESVDFLEGLNVPLYKVGSYEVTHLPLLKRIAKTGKPVILSVGYASQEEVERAIATLREHGARDIAVLYCVTGYSRHPRQEDTHLRTMLDIRDRYDVVCGFSDNNGGIEMAALAVAMGASIVEKHLVLNHEMHTLDEDFSIDPEELRALVKRIRNAERAMGTIQYGPHNDIETSNMRFRRSIFIVRDMQEGEVFTQENIRIIRPAFGLEPRSYEQVLGKKALRSIERGTPLSWDMISRQ